jgi:WD40 repeat protein
LASDGRLRLLDLASGRVRTLTDAGAQPQAFSPDGRTLSTAEDDGTVSLWDVEKGIRIETLEGHAGLTETHAFSPDGRTLYTAGNDGRVIVWDVAGDRRLGRPFPRGLGGLDGPPAFTPSPDGRTLAVARPDGRVELIDAETLRRTASFEAFPGRAAVAIDYSADGRRLAVAGSGGGVGVWDAESGERVGALLRVPRGPRRAKARTVQGLAFGQSDLLATAGAGGAVRIWDIDRHELLRAPLRLPPFVPGLAFSPDGSQLAIPFGADSDKGRGGVEILDVASGERVARLSPDGEVQSVAFSPDGGLLAGGLGDGGALLWATDGWGRVGRPLARQHGSTLGVEFSPDGRTLATSHSDRTVALWDVASQEPIGPILPQPAATDTGEASATARFTPDGAHLFVLYDTAESGASNPWRGISWEVDPELWLQRACSVAGGGLRPEQWAELVPEQDYTSACPSG